MPVFEKNGRHVAYNIAGNGAPVILLHGFPQTRALWTDVASKMAGQYHLIAPDLRGYGASAKPAASDDLASHSFREMAQDVLELARSLGHERFHLVGHDRGARVAYRLARDTPEVVHSLTLMDIVPTDHLVQTCDFALAKAYFHWAYLAQPSPFPERMIEADPDHFFESCLLGWGGATLGDFRHLNAYRAAWRDPATIAGMANDYRAAVSIDLEHDAEDDGRLMCPALVLYGASGVMAKTYDVRKVWARRFTDLRVEGVPGGHFFVDEQPDRTAEALGRFLSEHPM